MQINWIKIEGLFSVGEIYLNFDALAPITRIKGINHDTDPIGSNGAGKSAIIEAIYWCLSGKTIRKATNISNTRIDKKCRVTMQVNGNVIIERHKNPPKLSVIIDGKDHVGENMEETKAWLFDYLNITPELFLMSMVHGQANETGFLSATPEQKRKIIQNFLNLKQIFEKRDSIKVKKAETTTNLKAKQVLVDEIGQSNTKLKDKLNFARKSIQTANKIFSDPKSKDFIKNHSISQIQEMERKRSEVISLESSLGTQISRIHNELHYFNEELKKLEKEKCENCGFAVNERLLTNAREKIAHLTEEEHQKKKERNILLKELEGLEIPITVQDFELVEKIKDFQSQESIFSEQLVEQQARYDQLSKEALDLATEYELLKYWEQVFSEQGIIQFVIVNILDFFNDSVNKYLKQLSNNSLALFFNEKLEELIYIGEAETEFKNLSGGEKKRVNLAVMLALNDLLLFTGKNKSNVIFFDEVADSLDSIGVQGLVEIFDTLAKDKKIIVITHNDELNSLLEDESNIILVEKREGVTKLHAS
jgi:DNA repair exonuclease SbcCD ATPase subunit